MKGKGQSRNVITTVKYHLQASPNKKNYFRFVTHAFKYYFILFRRNSKISESLKLILLHQSFTSPLISHKTPDCFNEKFYFRFMTSKKDLFSFHDIKYQKLPCGV